MRELKPSLVTVEETVNELMNIACMLNLLSEHPDMQKPTLFGAVSAIKEQVIALSDKLDGED